MGLYKLIALLLSHTLAISITCPAKMVESKPTPNTSSYSLGVKLHNAFHIETIDYHSPPQQGSTNIMIPARIANKAKVMTKGCVISITSGGGIFASANRGIFAPTIKSEDENIYI